MSDKASPLRQPAPPADNAALQREVAGLIVAALNLDVAAADIDVQAPLYGDGLGLDQARSRSSQRTRHRQPRSRKQEFRLTHRMN